jgi:hypothetical protein
MMRKFAVALIATTMLVAPALAADAAKPTPAAPAATTTAPADTSAPKSDVKADAKSGIKTDAKAVTKSDVKADTKSDVKADAKTVTESATKTGKELKTKVAYSHHVRHMAYAKSGVRAGHVKTAKMSKPAAPVMTWFQWGAPTTAVKSEKHVRTLKVAHHVHHTTFAKNRKPASHVQTAKVSKPVDAVSTAPVTSTAPAGASTSKADVKVIKAGKEPKKSHLTAKVSKLVQPATEGKAGGEVAVKGNKVITN